MAVGWVLGEVEYKPRDLGSDRWYRVAIARWWRGHESIDFRVGRHGERGIWVWGRDRKGGAEALQSKLIETDWRWEEIRFFPDGIDIGGW